MLVFVSLALGFPAQDTSTDTCESYRLDGSIPANGTLEADADAPVLLLYRGGCGETLSWSLDGPDGFVADGTMPTPDYLRDGQVFRVDLPLMADTAYVLRITSDNGYEAPAELSFATVADPPEQPSLDDVQITMDVIDVFQPQQGILNVLADVVAAAPVGLLIHLSADAGQTTGRTWVADGTVHVNTFNQNTTTSEVCFSARSEDAEGNVGAWVETCEPVEASDPFPEDDEDLEPYKPKRCQSAPVPTTFGGVFLLLVGLRRRTSTCD